MPSYSEDSHQAQAYEQVTTAPHKAQISHELISAAAAYEAVKAYNKHTEKHGKPPSHDKAKEIMAGFAAAFVDHIVETKGLDFIDKQKAKHHAHEEVNVKLSEHYSN